ncbi:AT-hook motif nuclear-localized protein 5 [Cajanus cajan]|uniref:AT-hook motif nuclear-localized protein 5 n=1 Tax=Cajanus cajan TaxID=3821 RepID=UPI00098D9F24|nr:AT-hook motif nuclear-localized protein 5 [Cajanus cajan]XP_020215502.1 AT-hook motif nuclear-localized protein 5 [Cajanus cajan]XP_020215503.1 AT-hook motif nuclear-localized protein 5 [Cajanus cajan]
MLEGREGVAASRKGYADARENQDSDAVARHAKCCQHIQYFLGATPTQCCKDERKSCDGSSIQSSPSGVAPVITTPLPPQNMSHIQSLPMRMNTNVEAGKFSAPMISASDRKRRDSQAMDVPTISKKHRGRPPGRKNNVQGQNILPSSYNTVNNQVISTPCSATQSSAWNCALGGSQVQGSNAVNNQVVFTPCSATQSSAENCALGGSQVQRSRVVKSLFSPPSFPIPTNSPV